MEQIFINCDETLEPGEMVLGEVHGRMLAIRCVRVAALDEYLKFVEEKNLSHLVNRTIHDKNLYLVEVLD